MLFTPKNALSVFSGTYDKLLIAELCFEFVTSYADVSFKMFYIISLLH